MAAPFIELAGVRFSYRAGDRESLAGVDLAIGHGEFVSIIGPNGSGKSTLARCLNGLLLPVAGDVRIDGTPTTDRSALPGIRRKIGMAFQDPDNQIVASTVAEDVAFGPENAGVPSAEIGRRVKSALDTIGLADRADSPPDTLSGGQRQRLAIAGLLASEPACLVLDEPTSMLDPRGREDMLSLLRALNEGSGTTVILITQSMDEAASAPRVVVMNEGKVLMDGSPAAVFAEREPLEEIGLGMPAVAELAAMLRSAGIPIVGSPLTSEELARALW